MIKAEDLKHEGGEGGGEEYHGGDVEALARGITMQLNALALALGFRLNPQTLVYEPIPKTRAPWGSKTRKGRKLRTTAAPTTTAVARTTRRARGLELGAQLYANVRALEVGQSLDITDDVKRAAASYDSIVKRIGTFQWKERHDNGTRVSYRVARAHWRITVTRLA